MLSEIKRSIEQLDSFPEFSEFYQAYVNEIHESILANEVQVNTHKISLANFNSVSLATRSLNSVIIELNKLTEELNEL